MTTRPVPGSIFAVVAADRGFMSDLRSFAPNGLRRRLALTLGDRVLLSHRILNPSTPCT